jgi:hypothetical protein
MSMTSSGPRYGIRANGYGVESFYGFPDHYYKEKYPNVGSKQVAEKIMSLLKEAGIEVEGVSRGLDHGVWASFKCGEWLADGMWYLDVESDLGLDSKLLSRTKIRSTSQSSSCHSSALTTLTSIIVLGKRYRRSDPITFNL